MSTLQERLASITHYELWGVTEGASSHAISSAYATGQRVPEHLWVQILGLAPDEWSSEDGQVLDARRDEAFSVLDNPARRAWYDRTTFPRDQLLRSVAAGLPWGGLAVVAFGFLAFMTLFDHENVSRWVGIHLAPGYREERRYVDEERCVDRGNGEQCVQGYFVGVFHSRDPHWENLLNSSLAMSVPPAALAALAAFIAWIYLDDWLAKAIIAVRLAGYRDTVTRWLIGTAVIGSLGWVYIYFASYGLGRTR